MGRIAQRTVFATAVLVIAIAGAALAAGTITGKSIKDGTITGKDVRNHSLTRRDFKGSVRGPRGLRGPTGPQGPRGAPGTAGIALIGRIDGPPVAQGAFGSGGSEVQAATATCPGGSYAVGGGFVSGGIDNRVQVAQSPNPTQYSVLAINYDSSPTTIRAHVICAAGSGVHAASVRSTKTPAAIRRRVERLRAALDAR